jgi:hypothetical protein
LLSKERVVFLLGESEFVKWMNDYRYSLPSMLIDAGDSGSDLIQRVRKADRDRQMQVQQSLQMTTSYYQNLGKAGILQRLRNTPCRILVSTTLFSTAVQYYARDSAEALQDLGHEVRLWIEDNPLQKIGGAAKIREIASFKPDLVLLIDHFRFESSLYPPELAVATWIQDPLPWIMNSEAPKKLGDMDLIMNAFFSSPEIRAFGYPKEREVRAPIPVNIKRFEKIQENDVSLHKKNKDIIAFSNAGNPYKGFELFCKTFSSFINSDKKILVCLQTFFNDLYVESKNIRPIFTQKEIEKKLSDSFNNFSMKINEKSLAILAFEFFFQVNQRILRSVPLEWIADEGFDLSIYGEEWLDHPKLKKYAEGRAENSLLPSIIERSKITVGTNGYCSTHPRIGEAVFANSLYIGWDIPNDADVGSLREYISDDDGIIFFDSKDSLIRKTSYYLTHDHERYELIKNAKIAIKKNFTYEAVMQDMLTGAKKLLGVVKT